MLDDAFDDEVAVAVERGDARRRSRRSSRAPAARSFETVRLGSEDRVGLLLLKLCEAFPEMMDGGKKRKNAAAKAIILLARGGGELDAALTLRQSGVRARDARQRPTYTLRAAAVSEQHVRLDEGERIFLDGDPDGE